MPQPDFIPQAFAEYGDKNTIPETASGGAANWQQGFPPITSIPLGAGGVAPDRLDFNGIFYTLSAHAIYAQSGSVWAYSSELDYTAPAIVYDISDGGLYYCVGNNGPTYSNVTAPHEDTTGTYWQAVSWGEITWLSEAHPTRTADTTIAFSGDRTADFPRGKLLRFNGDDAYLCRVYGDPVLTSNTTSIQVWFDTATTIPETITLFERSRLSPTATARGVSLVTSTQYNDTQIETLLTSHCYSSIAVMDEED